MPPFEFGAAMTSTFSSKFLKSWLLNGPIVERMGDRAVGDHGAILDLECVLVPADFPAGEILSVEELGPSWLNRPLLRAAATGNGNIRVMMLIVARV